MLNFVNHYGTAQRTERNQRLFEARQAQGIFEIEVVCRALRNELPRQSGLATLARADERHHAAALQRSLDMREQPLSLDHEKYTIMKIPHFVEVFHDLRNPHLS